jgi:hypothetical protein
MKKAKTTRVLFKGVSVVRYRQYRDVTDEELKAIKKVFDNADDHKIDAMIDGFINKRDIDDGDDIEDGEVFIVTKEGGKEKFSMLYANEGYLDEDK